MRRRRAWRRANRSARTLRPQPAAGTRAEGCARAHPGQTLDPRADAPQADDQARPAALRATSLDDRTGLRPDQGEPRHPPLPATRRRGLRQRMETDRRQPQPGQALSPPAAPTLARAGRSPLSEASLRSDQIGPTPNYPCPISTDTLNPTTPRRLSTTPTVAKLYATTSTRGEAGTSVVQRKPTAGCADAGRPRRAPNRPSSWRSARPTRSRCRGSRSATRRSA